MGTKNNPGQFDVYAKLEPDEPFFVLAARDPDFEFFVRMWCHWRHRQIAHGMRARTEEEFAQIREAQLCASEGEIWGREWRNKRDKGRPTTGPHAFVEKTTTSGANERD